MKVALKEKSLAVTVTVTLDMLQNADYHSLDATCSIRRWWLGKNASGWLFLDVRKTVKPDIIASNEFLPFRDHVFESIFYDPPHFVRGGGFWKKSRMRFAFGEWRRKSELDRNLRNVNREFARCLKRSGKLIVKWSEAKSSAVKWARAQVALTNFHLMGLSVKASGSRNLNGSKTILAKFCMKEAA